MGKTVVAKAGECIISIAEAAGFADWHTVYDAPENADLKKKRPDPSFLVAGDEVFVPDFKALELTMNVSGSYTVHTKSLHATVELYMNDSSGNPYANKNWQLKVLDRIFKGTTNAKGLIKQKVPAEAKEGDLTLFLDTKGETKLEWTVDIGGLDPIDTDSGVQSRLGNLGYHIGEDQPGTIGAGTLRALRDFQNDHGLKVTGKLDEETRGRLKEEHHS